MRHSSSSLRNSSLLQAKMSLSIVNCATHCTHLINYIPYASTDKTQTGHVLGSPEGRTNTLPERTLSPAVICILRVLMHSALLWASCNVQVLIKMLPQFLFFNCTTIATEIWLHFHLNWYRYRVLQKQVNNFLVVNSPCFAEFYCWFCANDQVQLARASDSRVSVYAS